VGGAGPPPLPAIAALLTAAAAGGIAWGSSGGAFADHGIAGYAVAAAVLLPAAAWAGVLLGRRDRRRGLLAIGAGVAGVALLVVLAFPRVVPVRTAEELARRAALEPGATVACYACFHPSFPWVLGRSVVVTDHEGELATDGVRPPALYWEKDEFWRRWNSGERILAVSDDRWWVNFLRRSRVPPRLLAADGDRILVENHGP
jgi:hypothetical protein